MTMKEDLVNRSPDIHWPQGFDPTQADLFSHNELLINAKCEPVWQHIIDAAKWPDWYPNSKEVHIVGNGGTVLKEGTTFRWTTFGLPLESRINEFVPYSRIGWFGYAPPRIVARRHDAPSRQLRPRPEKAIFRPLALGQIQTAAETLCWPAAFPPAARQQAAQRSDRHRRSRFRFPDMPEALRRTRPITVSIRNRGFRAAA